MSSMQEDIQCAGSDTRPPMLDRTDFESWQQRIRLKQGAVFTRGIPKDIYSLFNHYTDAQRHWGKLEDDYGRSTSHQLNINLELRLMQGQSYGSIWESRGSDGVAKRLQDSDYFQDKMYYAMPRRMEQYWMKYTRSFLAGEQVQPTLTDVVDA
ncbi:hypothetical protein Tco_1135111 [Tanacetum coccineum]